MLLLLLHAPYDWLPSFRKVGDLLLVRPKLSLLLP